MRPQLCGAKPRAPPSTGPVEVVAFFDGNTLPLWVIGCNYEPRGALDRIASTTAAGLLKTGRRVVDIERGTTNWQQ